MCAIHISLAVYPPLNIPYIPIAIGESIVNVIDKRAVDCVEHRGHGGREQKQFASNKKSEGLYSVSVATETSLSGIPKTE